MDAINTYSLNEKLELIKTAILKYVPAKYIYLYGSYAYGNPTEHSDIDIYTVIPDGYTPIDMHNLRVDIADEWYKIIPEDVDLVIKTESKFDDRMKWSLFEETIYQKGRLLYATS